MNLPKSKVVYSAEQLQARIAELGAQITKDYDDGKPLVCVCVLRGAVMFFADLMKRIDSEQVVYDFVTLSSYENSMVVGGNMQTTGKIKLIADMREKVEGKHVLVIEDIVDSGNTVNYLREYFKTLSRFRICASEFHILNSPTSPYFFLVEKSPRTDL